MSNTSYVQVAVDSTGKKVMMDQQVLPDGTTGYMQLAQMTGDPADALQQLNTTLKSLLAVNRALLFAITQMTNFELSAEDFEDFRPSAS